MFVVKTTNSSIRRCWNGWVTSLAIIFAIGAVCALPTGEESSDHCLQKQDICLTPGCVHAASSVLKNMDPSVDPCDDFYQFACGGYIRDTTIPDDKIMLISFYDLNDLVEEQLKSVLQETRKPDESKPLVLIKQLYNLCMNTTAVEEDGLETANSILEDLGGWPVLQGAKWKDNKFQWFGIAHKLRKAGLPYNPFISVGIEMDVKNSSRNIITVDQAGLVLPREQLIEGLENTAVKAYYDYLVDVAVIFGADKSLALQEMQDLVKFASSLAKIQTPEEDRRNLSRMYNPVTAKELQEKYPSINWLEYLENIIGISDIKLSEDDVINVAEPQYITDLELLLEKTTKRILANYVLSKTVKTMVHYLTKELRNRELKFRENAYGIRAMPPRWKECVQEAVGGMGIAASALYVRKYFDEHAKENAQTLVSDLQATFLDMLKQIDWMDAGTRKKAIEKAEAMVSHIGYPAQLLDDKEIETHYQDMESNSVNYLKHDLLVRSFIINTAFKELRMPVDKSDWKHFSRVARVNAGYASDDNSIQLPAGILQGVFFDTQRPKYMNYGSIGFVIGHEITHGFDDMGSQFDKGGQLSDWWETHTKEAFLAKAKCVIEQYGNYTASEVGLNLNGINTQGENIADNGGIKEAYLAYNAWVERNGEEPRLPGLDYSPKQMFWISSANVWCSKQRDEFLKVQIMTDTHSPTYFRIIGTFSNSEYFARDFKCPIGSRMNPKHKCDVW